MKVIRSNEEIDRLMDQCITADADGSLYPGMSFEEGIKMTLLWLEDSDSPHPLDE